MFPFSVLKAGTLFGAVCQLLASVSCISSSRQHQGTVKMGFFHLSYLIVLAMGASALSVSGDLPDTPTMEEALIQLQKSPPSTADEFLARLRSQFPSAPSEMQLDSESSKVDYSIQINGKLSANDLFRSYATEDDSTNAIDTETSVDAKKETLRRPFSPAQLGDIPPAANCEPELRAITVAPLVAEQSSSSAPKMHSISSQGDIYFPRCIRLPVCGGCCPSERLRCSAVESTKQNISLLHLRFSARDRRFQLGGVVRVQVEKHQRCACQCVTKAADCRPGQLYRADECRCICPMAIKAACLKRQRAVGALLARFIVWKPERCECECKAPGGVRRCASGLWFDARTCSCQKLLVKSRNRNPIAP